MTFLDTRQLGEGDLGWMTHYLPEPINGSLEGQEAQGRIWGAGRRRLTADKAWSTQWNGWGILRIVTSISRGRFF